MVKSSSSPTVGSILMGMVNNQRGNMTIFLVILWDGSFLSLSRRTWITFRQHEVDHWNQGKDPDDTTGLTF